VQIAFASRWCIARAFHGDAQIYAPETGKSQGKIAGVLEMHRQQVLAQKLH
jgi:hypothetical protein